VELFFSLAMGAAPVIAEQAAKVSNPKAGAKAEKPDLIGFGISAPPLYPTFSVDHVIKQLTTATEDLIEKKIAKSADELRKKSRRVNVFPRNYPQLPSKVFRRKISIGA